MAAQEKAGFSMTQPLKTQEISAQMSMGQASNQNSRPESRQQVAYGEYNTTQVNAKSPPLSSTQNNSVVG